MSEKTLDHLIASLKSEGIEAAEKESKKILEEARSHSEQIVRAAEAQRDAMLAQAEEEANAIVDKGEKALRQASRDYSLSVRNELLAMFRSALDTETTRAFSSDALKSAIVKVIENVGGDVELKLSPQLTREVAGFIQSRVQSSDQPVTIVEDNKILSGFSVTRKDQGWSYSISPEDVSEALKGHLNSNWLEILNKEE